LVPRFKSWNIIINGGVSFNGSHSVVDVGKKWMNSIKTKIKTSVVFIEEWKMKKTTKKILLLLLYSIFFDVGDRHRCWLFFSCQPIKSMNKYAKKKTCMCRENHCHSMEHQAQLKREMLLS
jgi:hypothetical protein